MRRLVNLRPHAFYVWVLCCLLVPQVSWAVTSAGTVINNVASVSYSVLGIPQAPTLSNIASLKVDEVIDPTMTCQSSPTVAVNSPSVNDVLTFALTNSGNGSQTFSLARSNGGFVAPAVAGAYVPTNSAQYAPGNLAGATGAIFIETNGVAGFQPGSDTVYTGANNPVVAAGASQLVYVVSDTPGGLNTATNPIGDVLLTATSLTAGAASAVVGTRLPGKGANGSNALVVTPTAAVTCTYTASGLGLAMNKKILTVVDPYGGAVVMPGSILTYQITVSMNGAGSATGLVISDPIPVNTTYVLGSITTTVGGVVTAVPDATGYVASTNSVSVSLGNIVAPPASTSMITFRVTVN